MRAFLIFTIIFSFASCKQTNQNNQFDKDPKQEDTANTKQELNQTTPNKELITFAEITKQTKKFRGAYFEIAYPSNFTVKPSLTHSAGGYRSVYFLSPDGYAEFYIFSTWHQSDNNELVVNSEKENIEQNERMIKDEFNEIKYYTYAAKDQSYKRSYMDVIKSGQRTIYGIKYRNMDAYNYYKESYLKFKKSLKEFAD